MVLAMFSFAVEDVLIKWLAVSLSVAQILFMIGLGGMLIFWALAVRAGHRVWSSVFWHPAVIARNTFEIIGTIGFVTALALAPLTLVSVILQAAPLLVAMGAALFLGEQVGWRRWSAICVGFLGVLLILRPGTSSFEFSALYAVMGVAGLAARDVAMRRIPKSVPALQLSVYGFSALIPASCILFALGQPLVMPDAQTWTLLAFAIIISVIAYYLLVEATRRGDVSFVTPFRYSRLLFAIGFAYVFFAESVDIWMIVGSIMVVGSGLFMFAREAKVRSGFQEGM